MTATNLLGGPTEGHCTVHSFTIVAEQAGVLETCDPVDHGVMPWADLIDCIAVAGGTRPAYDLFEVPLPDGTVRRYRATSVRADT